MPLKYLVETIAELKRAVGIERKFLIRLRVYLPFRQHDRIWLHSLDAPPAFFPEIEWHPTADITPIAIGVEFADKVFHVAPEVLPQFRVAEVQLREVPFAIDNIAILVSLDKNRMLLQKTGRRAAMEINQVE